MKRSCFLRLLTGLALLACSLPAAEPVDLGVIHRIRREAFDNSKVMEHLYHLTEVNGPRLTGSPALQAAGEWVVKALEGWGADQAKLETWEGFGRGWSYSYFSAHLYEPRYAPLIGFPLAWTPGTDGPISGELTFALIDKDADFAAYEGKLQGKIVLAELPREVAFESTPTGRRFTNRDLDEIADAQIPEPKALFDFPKKDPPPEREEREKFRNRRNEFWVKQGVLAVLTAGEGRASSPGHRSQSGTVFGAAGGSWKKEDPVGPPMIALTPEHYNRLARLAAGKIPYRLELEVKAEFHDDAEPFTAVGEIRGARKPEEIVMLGGHLDSWHGGTGATDNGAGCSVMLEAFRILKALDLKLDRTVRLALWTGEEQGLLGSKAYVKAHFADPETMKLEPEHARLAAYFNVDNGAGKIRGVYLQENDMVRPIFRTWLEPFADLGATAISSRNTFGTDHLSFNAVGLPGFQFIQEPLEYGTRTHHSNMDVYDRVPPRDLMQAAAIVASFVYHAANRAEMLPRKPLPKPKPKDKKDDQAAPSGS